MSIEPRTAFLAKGTVPGSLCTATLQTVGKKQNLTSCENFGGLRQGLLRSLAGLQVCAANWRFVPLVRHRTRAQRRAGLDSGDLARCERPLWGSCAAPPRRRQRSDRSAAAKNAAVASGRFVPHSRPSHLPDRMAALSQFIGPGPRIRVDLAVEAQTLIPAVFTPKLTGRHDIQSKRLTFKNISKQWVTYIYSRKGATRVTSG